MGYLTEVEIPMYTTIPGVTVTDIENASIIMDSYKNMTYVAKEYTEKVPLKRKLGQFGDEYRGQLIHIPRCEILEVYANVRSPFGGAVKQTYDTSAIEFDSDILWWFTFYPQSTTNVNPFPVVTPMQIYIKYRAGYNDIPQTLKRACGIIADNIRKNGGFQRWSSRTDFDMTIALVQNEGILTSDIKRMLDSVQLT